MPKRTCPICDGRGGDGVDIDDIWICAHCGGTGEVDDHRRSHDQPTTKTKEECNMMTEGMKIAKVVFDGTPHRTYDYFTDLDLKEGDIVVVDSSTGLGVAKVLSVHTASKHANRWVVQKVDMSAHQQRLELGKKLADLRTAMEKRHKALQEIALYQMMAEKDDTMKSMLEQYQALMRGGSVT